MMVRRSWFLPFYGIVFFLTGSVAPQAQSVELENNAWAFYGYKVIDTHLYRWKERFFALTKKGELVRFSFPKGKVKRKEIYDYSDTPDIIKHFALKSGDLFVTIYKEDKKIRLNAFNPKGRAIYAKTFDVEVNIEQADIRVDQEGQPECLLYHRERHNYGVSLWRRGKIQDVYRIYHPIDYVFFQIKNKTVHMLHQIDNDYYWAVWSRRRYYQLKLPRHVLSPSFFSIGKKVFVLGVDLSGTIWKFTISYNRVISSKIVSNPELRFTQNIIPLVHKKKLRLFMPTVASNRIWSIQFNDFLKNRQSGGLTSQKVFLGERIHFLSHQKKLYMIMQTKSPHLYLQKLNTRKLHLYNFRWSIDLSRPPSLSISWETSRRKNYLYQYLLDHQNDSEPVGEGTSLPNNRLRIKNVKDGRHVFHLQAIDPKTRKKSYLYHIPIFWLYEPPEPKVVFLNTISPSTFLSGRLRFYIKNGLPIEYYADINTRQEHRPRRLLRDSSGTILLSTNLKTGWYYLHIQARDPKTRRLSTINHIPFAIKPYDPYIEREDPETDTTRTSLEELKKQIIKNKDNVVKLREIRRQLEALKKKEFE